MKRATDGAAIGGLAMPVWLPSLDQVSTVAAQLVPILSAAWLAVQILAFIKRRLS